MSFFPPAVQLPPARYLQGDPPTLVRRRDHEGPAEGRDLSLVPVRSGQVVLAYFYSKDGACTIILPTWTT